MAQCLRDQAHGEGRTAAKVQFAGIELGHLQHFVTELRGALYQATGVLQYYQAFRGWLQGFAGAVDQRAAEGLLQALDGTAERGLGDAHGLGGADETAVLGEGDEIAQLAKVHVELCDGKQG